MNGMSVFDDWRQVFQSVQSSKCAQDSFVRPRAAQSHEEQNYYCFGNRFGQRVYGLNGHG